MAELNECKDRETAISVLHVIADGMKYGSTQKAALLSVAEWIRSNSAFEDPTKMTFDDRCAAVQRIRLELRDSMNEEERREEAAFYLEGIGA